MIPTINKPSRVTRKTATAIDHNILTNSFIDTTIKTGVIKSDVSDHFPICLFIPSEKVSAENEIVYIYKRIINDETVEAFTQNLYENNLNDVESIRNPNDAYRIFLENFRTMYDKHFPLKTIKLKTKDLKSPWITAGIKKSSKQRQRFYTKFLKNRNQKNETEYKNYKKLFESMKRRLKKLHFSKLLLKYKNNIKKTWQIIKEEIGKEKCNQNRFSTKIVVDKENITNIHSIAENFNKCFTEIGPNLANKINPNEYLKEYQTSQPENVISVNELKDGFFSLKINKSPGYGDISLMLSKSALEFYTNLCCIFLTFLFKLRFFLMNLKLQALVLYLKEVEIGTTDLYPFCHVFPKYSEE